MKRKIKKQNEHLFQKNLKMLSKVVPLVKELRNLLNELSAESIKDFEDKINTSTGFVSARLSAEALGFQQEYIRLIQLEKEIDGRLEISDLDSNGNLNKDLVELIREKHIEYYTDTELKQIAKLNKVLNAYNRLSFDDKQMLMFANGNMIINHFCSLIR